jgi:prepilin-type N-terminal cleavage/methylation domain-containing protein
VTALLKRLQRASNERGFTLVEMLMVMLILTTILATLTQLFVTGMKSELDLNRRFEAQEQARTGVDRMRREIHCASAIALSVADPGGSGKYAQVDVSVPKQCPTGNGVNTTTVTYDVQQVSTSRYQLRRAGVVVGDYITSRYLFSYTAPSVTTLGKLKVDVPVNLNPNEGWKQWRLTTDIVLRNTLRKT